MVEAGLFDDAFQEFRTIALAGENSFEYPQFFKWERDKVKPTTFYTDGNLEKVRQVNDRVMRVALMIDPTVDTHHYKAFMMQEEFDYILTFSRAWVSKAKSPKWLYYPVGGSSISRSEWGIGEKNRGISLCKHNRGSARQHDAELSAEIARKASLFGITVYSVNPFERAIDFLQDYRYSIIVEKVKEDGYFSSRLIDCLSMGTIPIYFGDPNIGQSFDIDGIVPFGNTDELVSACVNLVNDESYLKAIPAIMRNLDTCDAYYCAEDYIYTHYPFLFEEKQ